MIRFMTNFIPPSVNKLLTQDEYQSWQAFQYKTIGEPQGTPFYTAGQLRTQGYVGIYTDCTPQEAVCLLNMSIDSYKRIPVLGLPESDKERHMLCDAHRICRAFGEILTAGYPLVIETISGRQYSVSSPPVIEGNSVFVFGDYSIEIAKIRSIRLEAPDA